MARRNTKDLLVNIYKKLIIENGLLAKATTDLCEGCQMEYQNQQGHACLYEEYQDYEQYIHYIFMNNLIPEEKVMEALKNELYENGRLDKTFVAKLVKVLKRKE